MYKYKIVYALDKQRYGNITKAAKWTTEIEALNDNEAYEAAVMLIPESCGQYRWYIDSVTDIGNLDGY